MPPKSYAAKPHDCPLQKAFTDMTLISHPQFNKVSTEDNRFVHVWCLSNYCRSFVHEVTWCSFSQGLPDRVFPQTSARKTAFCRACTPRHLTSEWRQHDLTYTWELKSKYNARMLELTPRWSFKHLFSLLNSFCSYRINCTTLQGPHKVFCGGEVQRHLVPPSTSL